MQYKISAIDSDPPREWNGPNGKVYYITVGLDGHPKPVSIGKKAPDALKVGDVVWGDIIPSEFETDKWKGSAPMPSTPTAVGPVAPFTPTAKAGQRSDAYLKDMSNAPILMYNGSLHYAKELGLNLITDQNDRRVYLEYVKDITDEMLLMIDNIRGSGGDSIASSTPTIKEAVKPATLSLGQQFRDRQQMSPEEANEFLGGLSDEE